MATAEPALLQFAIDHTGGSRTEAAELGIHRGTLRDRLRRMVWTTSRAAKGCRQPI
ncbi:MAG: helix-turn-helix domain-containing protein [Pirellulaceae bacterium]